jgi:hypothetical protein
VPELRQALRVELTFRWLHPLTLALHEIIFDVKPVERGQDIARKFVVRYSREELAEIVKEIRLELDEPTQLVRDSLDCRASEVELRQHLLSFCEWVERQQTGTQ